MMATVTPQVYIKNTHNSQIAPTEGQREKQFTTANLLESKVVIFVECRAKCRVNISMFFQDEKHLKMGKNWTDTILTSAKVSLLSFSCVPIK